VGALTLYGNENYLTSAVIDTANGYAYFGTNTAPGIVVKVRLSDFTRAGALTLSEGENWLHSAVIDTVNGFAYFGTDTSPGRIVKIKLTDFTRVGALSPGESYFRSAVIDTANGSAYFGTFTSPWTGEIVKVRLSDFSRVGVLPIDECVTSAVIDTVSGFAYFGGIYQVMKVRLSNFTRVGAISVYSNHLTSAVIDTANGFAYFGTFGTDDSPGRIVKIRLSDFTYNGTVTLNTGESRLRSAVIDTANGYAYFGTDTTPGIVVRIRLSDFTRVGALTLDPGQNNLWSAVVDAAGGFAYFGTYTAPGIVVKIYGEPFDFSLSNTGAITLAQGGSGSNIITIGLVSGSTRTVTLSASGIPGGASLSWSPSASGNPPCDIQLTVTAYSWASTGSYIIVVTGTGAGISHITLFTLTVLKLSTTTTTTTVTSSSTFTSRSSTSVTTSPRSTTTTTTTIWSTWCQTTTITQTSGLSSTTYTTRTTLYSTLTSHSTTTLSSSSTLTSSTTEISKTGSTTIYGAWSTVTTTSGNTVYVNIIAQQTLVEQFLQKIVSTLFQWFSELTRITQSLFVTENVKETVVKVEPTAGVSSLTFTLDHRIIGSMGRTIKMTVQIQGLTGIGSYQVKATVPTEVSVGPYSGTGFFLNPTYLFQGTEHRWFNTAANGQSSGSLTIDLTVPKSLLNGTHYLIVVQAVDLKDGSGNLIGTNPNPPTTLTVDIIYPVTIPMIFDALDAFFHNTSYRPISRVPTARDIFDLLDIFFG
jgi:hypothetical protein